jgi:hypothetical protein
MQLRRIAGLVCLAAAACAQDVHFNFDRSANFSSYQTYRWVDVKSGQAPDQLIDQNIKRAVDEQLLLKGLRRVETGGDLQVGYQVALDREKQFNGFSMGPRWNAMGTMNTSTIEIGKIAVEMFDPARQQLVWRGDAVKTLAVNKDPEKNCQNLKKSMAKLFKNYPPGAGR